MTTDDFSLDQVERSQREQTRRRRDKQSRRKQLYFLGGVVALALLVFGRTQSSLPFINGAIDGQEVFGRIWVRG